MAKKQTRTRKEKSATSRIRQTKRATHKTNTRKVRAVAEAKPKVKASPKPQPQQKSAGANRAQGIALFKLAGRPTKEQFILVYGQAGPRMTWEQRGAAGVRAEEFQAALAEKAVSRRTASK